MTLPHPVSLAEDERPPSKAAKRKQSDEDERAADDAKRPKGVHSISDEEVVIGRIRVMARVMS